MCTIRNFVVVFSSVIVHVLTDTGGFCEQLQNELRLGMDLAVSDSDSAPEESAVVLHEVHDSLLVDACMLCCCDSHFRVSAEECSQFSVRIVCSWNIVTIVFFYTLPSVSPQGF